MGRKRVKGKACQVPEVSKNTRYCALLYTLELHRVASVYLLDPIAKTLVDIHVVWCGDGWLRLHNGDLFFGRGWWVVWRNRRRVGVDNICADVFGQCREEGNVVVFHAVLQDV